jgi:hypothetical protein
MAKKISYECEKVPLSPDQIQALQMNLLSSENIDTINNVILDILNRRGEDGWRLIAPISLPTLWFEKEKTTRSRKANG